MKTTLKVSSIIVFGLVVSITLPTIITSTVSQTLKNKEVPKIEATSNTDDNNQTQNKAIAMVEEKSTAEIEENEPEEEPEVIVEQEPQVIEETPVEEKVVPEVQILSYDEITNEQLPSAIENGSFKLEYSSEYSTGNNKLTKSRGAIYYDGHKETYYSQRVLPGSSLNIPGRHIADDQTIRDGEGYICVAANTSYLSKGTIVKTSLGPAKVYDTGCAYGTIDIYTNW